MDFRYQEFAKALKKQNEDCDKAHKERMERMLNGFCYCDLQHHFPLESNICKFCYEKAKEEIDKDQLADEADYQNKHNKEQMIYNFDSPWEPL